MPALLARLVAGPNAPSAARERAADFFSDVATNDDVARLRLLVSEIVSEAVERAGDRRVVLELSLEHDIHRLHITVGPTGPFTREGSTLRRAILDRTSALWGFDEGAGGRLWFELDLDAS